MRKYQSVHPHPYSIKMENIQEIENRAFQNGKQTNGSALSVSSLPLFIDARGKENENFEKIRWKVRRFCLFHGERFRWKKRCSSCRYLIRFEEKASKAFLSSR